MSITTPHDSLFKFAFGDPVHAAAFLRSLLPPEVAALVAWESFVAERGSFVSPELQSRHSDLLFSLRIGGQPALAYFLFEHQRSPDPLMPYRILVYIVRIWEWWRAQHPKDSKLPAIIPVVLHHGEQGWTAARELTELIDLTPDALTSLEHFLPRLRIQVDDLATQTDTELYARALTDLGRLTLLIFRDLPQAKAPGAVLAKHLELLLRVIRAPSGLRALEALMSYTLATTDLATEDLVHNEDGRCTRKEVAVVCPAGSVLESGRCVAQVSTSCGAGMHFVAGTGCVPNVVAPSPAPAASADRGGMVSIPAGTFQMGSNDGDADERPVHAVRVAAFAMDRTPVTVAAYQQCVSAGRCSAPVSGDYCNGNKSDRQDHPINCVGWDQVTQFCQYVGKRLPTEEEWEYAARGTDGRKYPWGNEAPGNQLCWNRWNSKEGTCAVGSYSNGASPFGILDMAGNVWEWTSSNYRDYNKSRVNATRVLRGGSWSSAARRTSAPRIASGATRRTSTTSSASAAPGRRERGRHDYY